MNVLDENILESQRQLLRSWRVRVRQIGHELGRKGMADEAIIPFLLTLLRHRDFNTQAKRMGTVIRIMHTGVVTWRLHLNEESRLAWPD